MKGTKKIFTGIVLVAALFLFFSSMYIVNETQQVVITQFGKPVGNAIVDPGIHLKVPFIQVAHYFDKRFLEWDGYPNQVPTKDKRFIWVDSYSRWRISDPLLFFQRLRDETGAHSRLDDILDGETRNAIASHDLIEIVRTSNRQAVETSDLEEEQTTLENISTGRSGIEQIILETSQKRTADLGIEVLDFKFKRINYVEEVQKKVFERMITERKRIADKYRSEGQGEASRINGEKDRELKRIQSEAYREAQEIVGRADASATQIYNEAYNMSRETQEFYQFLKTMETYEHTIDKTTTFILSTEGDFYKFIQGQK
ncbi:MAG TPA: protease modulator HflC [Candidatus Marinimicrobia bacterium]|nr:protease modulator HflC [Candidatus Neomarinimicrobiota bacterium]